MVVIWEVEIVVFEVFVVVYVCGLFYGDVFLSNIMVVWGKKFIVCILDFGFLCIISNKKL